MSLEIVHCEKQGEGSTDRDVTLIRWSSLKAKVIPFFFPYNPWSYSIFSLSVATGWVCARYTTQVVQVDERMHRINSHKVCRKCRRDHIMISVGPI